MSIILWNVWPAFFSPNGILMNSKSPNGVQIAVFCTSEGLTGTWWYPFLKSSLEKTRAPCNLAARSAMLGTEYLSGSVCRFNRRKSPHGLQDPSDFLTICSGDAQLLLDLRIMPCCSKERNSALAAANFSASNLRYLDATGRPEVSITCCTACFAGGSSLEALQTSGNSAMT